MRGNKNKGIVKVLGIGLTAAVLSFTLTGVAENAVTGAVSGKSVSDGLRQLTALSVMLAVPVNEFDGRDEDTVSSEPCTEKPDNETKTEKQEQQEQKVPATDNPSSSTEDTSGETLVPVDAPPPRRCKNTADFRQHKKGQGRSYTVYGKGRYGKGKALRKDRRRQCNRPRKRSDKKLHQAAVGAYRR